MKSEIEAVQGMVENAKTVKIRYNIEKWAKGSTIYPNEKVFSSLFIFRCKNVYKPIFMSEKAFNKLQEEAKSNVFLNQLKEQDNYESIKEALSGKKRFFEYIRQ